MNDVNSNHTELLGKYLWTKANKEDVIKTLHDVRENLGETSYFLQTDSIYKTSKSAPKKYYAFKYNGYYETKILKYEFIMVEEKGEFKLASVTYNEYKGSYDDPYLNYGLINVPKVFIDYVTTGKTEEAYLIFSNDLRKTVDLAGFEKMCATVNESLGELKSIEFIDTCGALNYYNFDESMGLFAVRLKGTKTDLIFNGTVAANQSGTFFLTRFQIYENYEINNLSDMKTAEELIDQFYFIMETGAYDKLSSILHPDLLEIRSINDMSKLMVEIKSVAGKHKKHETVSQIFSRNKNYSDLNKFMMIVRSENQARTFHDNFLLAFDRDNNLKISYVYFVEY
ncbi:MAG: hypothetical protein Q8M29_19955 [Bacteroidota bacterium]|nr:hypothetical protein [Bacteroidota bacterium]